MITADMAYPVSREAPRLSHSQRSVAAPPSTSEFQPRACAPKYPPASRSCADDHNRYAAHPSGATTTAAHALGLRRSPAITATASTMNSPSAVDRVNPASRNSSPARPHRLSTTPTSPHAANAKNSASV